MIARFFGALAIEIVVGGLISLFLWMVLDAVGVLPDPRDRVRPWTRDC